MNKIVKHPYTELEIAEHFFSEMSSTDKESVIDVPNRDFMSIFHDTVGMYIRNKYHLWERPHWVPEIVDGIDFSPQHPDAISGRVLELIWELCHE